MIYLLTNFGGALVYMGGAAGILAVAFLVLPILMKIIIFELSKDQTFRIWSTFKSPEQILILVTDLFVVKETQDFEISYKNWRWYWDELLECAWLVAVSDVLELIHHGKNSFAK
jgi:hypothetical protein